MLMELASYAFTFGSSLFDVWSDLANSLTFLGYYQSASIGNAFNTNSSNENVVQCHELVNGTTPSVHKMWGGISMSLIFIPGCLAAVPCLIKELCERKWANAALTTGVILFFPIFLFGVQLKVIISTLRRIKVTSCEQSLAKTLIGIEASIESSAQLILQLFTIIYQYPVTKIQSITIMTSFVHLAYSSILKDIDTKLYIMELHEDVSFCDTLTAKLYRVPGYTSTIIFRVGSLVVTMAYLRWFSVIPLALLFLELVLVAWLRCRVLKDKKEALVNVAHLTLGNIGVLNAFAFENLENRRRENDKHVKNFVVRSSVITFLHHTTVIIVIIFIGCYKPNLFHQNLIIRPYNDNENKYNERFFWLLGGLLSMGIYSLTVILYRADKITAFQVAATKRKVEKATQTEDIKRCTPYDLLLSRMQD